MYETDTVVVVPATTDRTPTLLPNPVIWTLEYVEGAVIGEVGFGVGDGCTAPGSTTIPPTAILVVIALFQFGFDTYWSGNMYTFRVQLDWVVVSPVDKIDKSTGRMPYCLLSLVAAEVPAT